MKRLVLAAASAALLSACSTEAERTDKTAQVAAGAERLIVHRTMIEDLRPTPALAVAKDEAEARARIGGVLARLNVKEGDHVRKGQVLAVIEDARLGLQTSAYDAGAAAAEAEALRARADLARTQDLYEHGVYAKARLEQVQAAAKAAEGQWKAAKAQRAASAEMSAQGAVLAPADGVVLRAPVPAGSVVMPGQSVLTLTAGPRVVRLQMPEAQAGALKVGQVVALRGDDHAVVDQGKVRQVYPGLTAGAATVDLDAPKAADGFVGKRLEALVPVGQRPAMVVPARFMVSRYGVDYVRALGKGGQVSEVVVQTAPAAGSQVEILSGLADGDTLVGAGK
jgi:RND family efflux transporter MFP subunit